MRFDTILVPLDGSELAEGALETAVDFLKGHSTAQLVLLRAAEASTLTGRDRTEEQVRVVREAEGYLDAVVARLRENGVTNLKASVWYGPAASTIVEASERDKVDLIIMSSHGRSGFGRLIFGSVAESVLRGTRIPILLVRDTGAPVSPPLGAAALRSGRVTTHV